ncbi:MAG TPA: methylated-DNA--[protein]-cysteine S-methyltransferase [Limnochordales bacterium]
MTSLGPMTIATPLGPLEIYGGPQGVRAIRFARSSTKGQEVRIAPGQAADESKAIPDDGHAGSAVPNDAFPAPVRQAAAQLKEYFAGHRREFDFPLDLEGTPFQLAVWRCLCSIPFGETRSYAWVARTIGRPTAFRAVGQAIGSNPIPIVVPCHRVIASDGSFGGYTGGLDIKRFLLRLEGAEAATG